VFAERVIRNRLIDYFRKEQVFHHQIPFSSLANSEEQYDDVQNRIDVGQSLDEFSRQQLNEARRLEIEEFQLLLADFSVTISDLVQLAPKHEDSRLQLIAVARQLAADKHIVTQIISTKKLPLNEMADKLAVSRKTLERHRKYLIALTIILTDAFPYLQSFLKFTERRESHE
jgi:RNA polymerase sigma factor